MNTFGRNFKVQVFGESHGEAIGVVVQGVKAGIPLCKDDFMKDILRRGEPDTPTGQHCLEPYACPYQHYCAQGVRQLTLF